MRMLFTVTLLFQLRMLIVLLKTEGRRVLIPVPLPVQPPCKVNVKPAAEAHPNDPSIVTADPESGVGPCSIQITPLAVGVKLATNVDRFAYGEEQVGEPGVIPVGHQTGPPLLRISCAACEPSANLSPFESTITTLVPDGTLDKLFDEGCELRVEPAEEGGVGGVVPLSARTGAVNTALTMSA